MKLFIILGAILTSQVLWGTPVSTQSCEIMINWTTANVFQATEKSGQVNIIVRNNPPLQGRQVKHFSFGCWANSDVNANSCTLQGLSQILGQPVRARAVISQVSRPCQSYACDWDKMVNSEVLQLEFENGLVLKSTVNLPTE